MCYIGEKLLQVSGMSDVQMSQVMPQQGGLGQCGTVQPLPANMIHKQPSTIDAQYMQQQSQIFVFSTQLANKAAEAVLQGQFPSVIAYHCSQPGTKSFLEVTNYFPAFGGSMVCHYDLHDYYLFILEAPVENSAVQSPKSCHVAK